MFPETFVVRACFSNVSQFSHTRNIISSYNFCFREAKYVSVVLQKHILLLGNECFWKHVYFVLPVLKSYESAHVSRLAFYTSEYSQNIFYAVIKGCVFLTCLTSGD